MLGSLLSCNASRHFAAASVEVRCQTGRSSSTTMVSPAALPLPRLLLAHCSAQTGCRGRIDPMCLLWGRGGRRYRAPREPGCRTRERGKMESRENEWPALQEALPLDNLPFHLRPLRNGTSSLILWQHAYISKEIQFLYLDLCLPPRNCRWK